MTIAAKLACPQDRLRLASEKGGLVCPTGHFFPIEADVPLLLLPDAQPTQPGYWAIGEEVWRDEHVTTPEPGAIDPYVRRILVGTCGNLYRPLARPDRYPMPELPLPPGESRSLLDVGSNWGRWCIAAARKGYRPVGIDPSLGAIRTAQRVADELNVGADYVVGDARHLPFADRSFDVVFSYSVLQHFSDTDALAAIDEVGRVLKPGGTALLQMAGRYGLRNLERQVRRGFAPGRGSMFGTGLRTGARRVRAVDRPNATRSGRFPHSEPTGCRP